MAGVKDKIIIIIKSNATENYRKPTRVDNMSGDRRQPRKPKIKKQLDDNIIKASKDRIIRDIKNLFNQEEDYYTSVRVGNFYSNNYIEYESNCVKIETISIK